LIAEFSPKGRYEDHLIATMAQLLWRLQNLATFRLAGHVRTRFYQIINEKAPDKLILTGFEDSPAERAARQEATREAEHQIQKEFGDARLFVEMRDEATVEALEKELEIQERLEGMLERCLKRLLFARPMRAIGRQEYARP
jgi:hypothetical protein